MVFRARGNGTGQVVRNAASEPLNDPTHWFVPAVRAAKIRGYKWHDNAYLRVTSRTGRNAARQHRGITSIAPKPNAQSSGVVCVH